MKSRMHLIVLLVLYVDASASAQDGPLPARCLQRIGATQLRHGSRILSLAYSHDGKVLAAGGGNDPVRLWDTKTGQLLRTLPEAWVHALAFSPSGETLLYGGEHRAVKLWNFRLKKETGRLDGHKGAVKAIVVSPDTSTIVTAGQDGALYLWDMNNKRRFAELAGHEGDVNALVYYADADNVGFLASAGTDRRIILWDVEKNVARRTIDAGAGVYALAVSADGKTLYSAGDDHLIRRWNVADGKPTGVFKGHEGIVVSLHLRDNTLISGSLDHTVRLWDAATTKHLRTLERRAGDGDALAVTRTGDFLATAGINHVIRIYEAGSFKEVTHAPGILSPLAGLALSPDGRRLVAVDAEGQVRVWDAASRKLVRHWETKHVGDIRVALADDGRTLALATTSIDLWDAQTGVAAVKIPRAANNPVAALAFAPASKTLALAAPGGAIELWDSSRKLAGSFKYPGMLHALAWSEDGKLLAAAGGSRIVVWDAATSTVVKSFDVKQPPAPTGHVVKALAFARDNHTLAVAGWDGIVRICNLHASNPGFVKQQRLCEGHPSAVNAIAFSADGRTLATGGFDNTVRLWEAFSGKQIAQFNGHAGPITGLAFARDGLSVYSAGADTVIYQWDVPGILKNGKLPDLTLGVQEIEDAWLTLMTEETAQGHETMWRCIASGKQAVPHLAKKLESILIDPEKVKKLFRDLNSDHFPTRTAAMNELPKYGRWMEGRYDAAIAEPISVEYRRRIEILKEKLNAISSTSLVQERLRARRIMLMCEYVASADAVAALRHLAANGPEEDIRAEASASLRRLGRAK